MNMDMHWSVLYWPDDDNSAGDQDHSDQERWSNIFAMHTPSFTWALSRDVQGMTLYQPSYHY